MKKVVAFFDFDGTLFQGHFWQGIVKYNITHKKKLASVSTYLGAHIPLWLANKFHILSEGAYKVRWGEDVANLFKKLEKEEGLKVFEWIKSNYFRGLLRSDIMTILRRHTNEGHTTVLLSGSFNDFLQIVKRDLGIDYAVGTKLEVINNVYSGRIIKPLCLGINKTKRVKEFISHAKLNIDFSSSFAYGDSILDAPVMEMVGNPVAVYPDNKLFNLAQQRGWEIIGNPGHSSAHK